MIFYQNISLNLIEVNRSALKSLPTINQTATIKKRFTDTLEAFPNIATIINM